MFYKSADRIILEDNHILSCRCRDKDGQMKYARFDLNTCIGNNNGRFHWNGHDFTSSASQIHLTLEGNDRAPILHAQLNDRHGSQQSASLNLGDCLKNVNGKLEYMECW
ncbi:hypothetical protein ASPZODRAFT_137010 [Penicilliopsis zonata CBS 506.65]|uniref:Cyanovirin-N domain-containing protein n=1 Tax=Penicilliopsis zonata CBS 506.65 TaxID=1073090 RepID=A0A1L9S6R8_9EURO|nr:hypothetical protein ASPZODRAFT_137010 [Penicilliopsis zonata CBS 506.65]OJJ42866.1 hypothetical protein ASPZODRAFT_137010 [Penicilliopsis zonata CBS 506.65]